MRPADTPDIWIWQRMVSPHMAGLAKALAAEGVRVNYVAQCSISKERASQGWTSADLGEAKLVTCENLRDITSIVTSAPANAIHICQGIRGHYQAKALQHALADSGRRYWVLMESVDDRGLVGAVKRRIYERHFRKKVDSIEGILAIGAQSKPWIASRGIPDKRIYPFAYFLPHAEALTHGERDTYRILFVGRLVHLKGLDVLLKALLLLGDSSFELHVIGTGPDEDTLRRKAQQLADRVSWLGQVPMDDVRSHMRNADLLVLPSRYDGWGAVVSEALMVGTPVICSDQCGAVSAVEESGFGGHFKSESHVELAELISRDCASGPFDNERRNELATWAACLSSASGAHYLRSILQHSHFGGVRPVPPWQARRSS